MLLNSALFNLLACLSRSNAIFIVEERSSIYSFIDINNNNNNNNNGYF